MFHRTIKKKATTFQRAWGQKAEVESVLGVRDEVECQKEKILHHNETMVSSAA